MSVQGSGGAGEASEVIALVQQLRADLEAMTEAELRRQARLAGFDQQIAQLEGSIRGEVERLRATGATVEMQTDLLRRAVEESRGDDGADGLRDELARIREELASFPRPDNSAVLTALDGVAQQLGTLERSVEASSDGDALAALAARVADLSDRVQALAVPDLQPVHGHLDELSARIGAIPQPAPPDLSPIRSELAQVRDQIAQLPVADDAAVLGALGGISDRLSALDGSLEEALAPVARRETIDQLTHEVRELAGRVDGLTPPDLAPHVEPLIERLDTLHARVAAIPARDLRPLHDQLDALHAAVTAIPTDLPTVDLGPLHDQLDALHAAVAAIPTDLPTVDLGPLHARLTELHDQIATLPTDLPTVDLGPLHARLTELRDQIATLPTDLPTVDLGPLHARLTELRDQIATLPTDLPTVDLDPIRSTLASELQTLGAELQGLRDHVGGLPTEIPAVDLTPLHSRLTQLRDQIDALPRVDPETLRLEVQAELQSVREMIAATPVVDLGPVVGRLGALKEQLDALPTTDLGPVEQRIDELRAQVAAIPAVDLEPVLSRLSSLRDQLASIPAPDLDTVRLEIQSEAQRTRDLVESIPTVDLASVHSRVASSHDRLATDLQRLRDQLDAIPQPDLEGLRAALVGEAERIRELIDAIPSVDLDPLHHHLTSDAERLTNELRNVREQLDAIPAPDLAPVEAHLVELRQQLDELPRPDDAAVRAAVAAVAEQVADAHRAIDALPQPELIHALAEAVVRLGERLDAVRERVEAAPDPTAQLHTISGGVQTLGAQVAGLPDHTQAIDNVSVAIETLRERTEANAAPLETLTTGVETVLAKLDGLLVEVGRLPDPAPALDSVATAVRSLEAGAARGFAAAQQAAAEHNGTVTSAIGDAIAELRTSVAAQVEAAKLETIRELDERLLGRMRATEGRIDAALRDLGDRLENLPLPDLSPVATQLARLSATVTSQTRVQPAGAAELDQLGTSLTAALANALEQLERQGAVASRMAEAIEAMPDTAEQSKALHDALDRRYEETAAALAVLTLELAETRALVERRGGRRRRGSSDDVPALPVHVFQQTLAENMQRELDAMKGHITVLGDRVERALAASTPAPARPPLRSVSARPKPAAAAPPAPTAPAPGPERPHPDQAPTRPAPDAEAAETTTARKRTAKKAPAKKAPAKKSTAKKSTAKKSTAKKSTAKQKAAAKKTAAPKQRTAQATEGPTATDSGPDET